MTHQPFHALTPEEMNLLLPAFEFTALISSSDHSIVFTANQRSLERHVAIKIFSPDVSADSVFRESFENAARTMAKLRHPNLIGVYDSGMVAGMLYYVMEMIPGKSLGHSSRGQCVEYLQTIGLAEGICNGLIHAHEHGIFHGGITPSCILLNQKAEPKISHFGIHYAPDGKANPFMAPEIISSGAAANQSVDQYAVGAIIYQLLTGQPHALDAPAPSTLTNCNPGIDSVWRKATQPDPAMRYVGMREFHKEIVHLQKVGHAAITDTQGAARRVATKVQQASLVPPAAKSRRIVAKPTFNYWGMLLNIFLLGVLWLVYVKVWKKRTPPTQIQEIQNQVRSVEATEDEKKSIAEAKKLAEEGILPSDSNHINRSASSSETQDQSLERLRSALVSGKREEMPVGSVRRDSSDYLLINQPLSWPDAANYAELHGAHLVIPSVGADLAWLAGTIAKQQSVWIGIARNGPQTWALANGESWITLKEPSGTGNYVMLDKDGSLQTDDGDSVRPFIIQWHRDGSNPGSLDKLLTNMKVSRAAKQPFCPPSTRMIGSRRYLFVQRPVSWEDARTLAASSGGHLAVPASNEEAEFLAEMAKEHNAAKGIWLGGFLKDKQWSWITGEPWESVERISADVSDAPDSTLLLLPDKGWSCGNAATQASGFFIEWSNDEKSLPASDPNIAKKNPSSLIDLLALELKAKELVMAADLKRTEQLKLNAKNLVTKLDVHIRNLPNSGREKYRPAVEKIKASITRDRVPSVVSYSSKKMTYVKIDELVKEHGTHQQQIDAEFLLVSGKIHAAYLAKIRDAFAKAEQGFEAQSLTDVLALSQNLERWIRLLGVEAKPKNPTF